MASGRISRSNGRRRERQFQMSTIDYSVFVLYMVATLGLGFAAGRTARGRPRDYFLGEKKLPWYVIGTSMVAADISSETFIAHVGIAYQFGLVVATQSWNAWIIYTIFLFVFLPYYVRTGLYTMPQFLERRYNPTCRYLFAVSLVIGYIFTLLAGSLYAGGLAIEQIFELQISSDLATNIKWGIVFFAVTTGTYTIYGGMKSSAWTDFMQMIVLLFAGILLPILALQRTGGLVELAHEMPEKFNMFLPAAHERFPWSGVYTGFITVGLWYTCASQHIVQRVLSAKDEWHARMGVISAGFLRIITPAFFVIPGIAAVKLFPHLEKPDHAYLMLVKSLIPVGLKGLILAGMAAALMSTVSTVLNSTSTLLTIDIYKKLLRPNAGDREQVLFGMIVGVVVLVLSVYIAFLYSDALTRPTPAAATAAQAAESAATTKVLTPKPETHGPESLFVVVQQVFFYI